MNFNEALLESVIYALAYVECVAKRYSWSAQPALRGNRSNRHREGLVLEAGAAFRALHFPPFFPLYICLIGTWTSMHLPHAHTGPQFVANIFVGLPKFGANADLPPSLAGASSSLTQHSKGLQHGKHQHQSPCPLPVPHPPTRPPIHPHLSVLSDRQWWLTLWGKGKLNPWLTFRALCGVQRFFVQKVWPLCFCCLKAMDKTECLSASLWT